MPTYGPSGTCGDPPQACFTPADLASYAAAIASKNSEKDDLEAQIAVIDQDLAALEHEQGDAVRNSCPS